MYNQKGFGLIGIIIVVVIILAAGVGGLYVSNTATQKSTLEVGQDAIQQAQEVKELMEQRNQQISDEQGLKLEDETATWFSYTYLSTESGILPDITFKYPAVFGNDPTLVSSRNTNRPENISDDWGGFVEFSKKGTFGDDGLRIEFFKRANSEANFDNYVAKSVASGGRASPKYFKAGDYRVARIRFASSTHYDADVGWYFMELSNRDILAISTSGDKKYLYDDDQSGNSTRDKIISTLRFTD